MIKRASFNDLASVKSLTEDCSRAMQQIGIFQWNEHYPSKDRLREDIENQELFLYKIRESLIGIMVLTTNMDEEYRNIDWLTAGNESLYVHRLATMPSLWGKGYGRELMDYAEKWARNNNCLSVRLDTFSQNERNQRFYEKRGYKQLGPVFFPKQSNHPFYCYEKVLK